MQFILTDYQQCQLCPRLCNINRQKQQGICGESDLRIASFTVHFGEEPCISGTKGSGTIFFSGCSCHCFFCQNFQISHCGFGEKFSLEEFYLECKKLIAQNVHNLNFVTPDHFEPHIRQVALRLREEGEILPFLWNGSGYHRPELVDKWCDYIDIFLPDFKFFSAELSQKCMHDRKYSYYALKSLEKMIENKGFLFPWGSSSEVIAKEGVMVRHLVLPGQVEDSIKVLETLFKEFGRYLPISLMSQFSPTKTCKTLNLFNRLITVEEYRQVCNVAEELGFESLFIQENNGDQDFMPDFSRSDSPFIGNQKQQEFLNNEKR